MALRSNQSSENESQIPYADRPAWLVKLHAWKRRRGLLARLASDIPEDRNNAVTDLIAEGKSALPDLCRALHGPIPVACGAAIALSRLGSDIGIQTVLIRCHDEEWLTEREARSDIKDILRRLDRDGICAALIASLSTVPRERELQVCFDRLNLAISACRMLIIFEQPSPLPIWRQALHFGHRSLPKLQGHPFAGLAYGLTDYIRAAALRGLFSQYPDACFDLMVEAFYDQDTSVARTAIAGFQRLADPRALPHLQPVAFAPSHPLALDARRVVEKLAGAQADSLVLLRGSYADANVTRQDCLLRPKDPPDEDTSSLLKPT